MRTSSQQRRRAVYRFTRLLLLDPTPTHFSGIALHVSLNPRPNMKTDGPMESTCDLSTQRNQCIRSNVVRPSTVNEYAPRTLAGWTHHGTTPRRGKQRAQEGERIRKLTTQRACHRGSNIKGAEWDAHGRIAAGLPTSRINARQNQP